VTELPTAKHIPKEKNSGCPKNTYGIRVDVNLFNFFWSYELRRSSQGSNRYPNERSIYRYDGRLNPKLYGLFLASPATSKKWKSLQGSNFDGQRPTCCSGDRAMLRSAAFNPSLTSWMLLRLIGVGSSHTRLCGKGTSTVPKDDQF
jgi:hypothetical protein